MHDTPYEKPRASQIARAAAGLWAISSALKEAAPHVLKYTTVRPPLLLKPISALRLVGANAMLMPAGAANETRCIGLE